MATVENRPIRKVETWFEVIQINREATKNWSLDIPVVLGAVVKSDKNRFVYHSGIVYVDIVVWQEFLNNIQNPSTTIQNR